MWIIVLLIIFFIVDLASTCIATRPITALTTSLLIPSIFAQNVYSAALVIFFSCVQSFIFVGNFFLPCIYIVPIVGLRMLFVYYIFGSPLIGAMIGEVIAIKGFFTFIAPVAGQNGLVMLINMAVAALMIGCYYIYRLRYPG